MSKALIVCSTLKDAEIFRQFLIQNDYDEIIIVNNGEAAKRKFIDNDYDVCLINAPVLGESGEQLSINIASKNICQVILFVKAMYIDEISERVENFGVITVAKPISKQMFWSALKIAKVTQNRIMMAQSENKKLKTQFDSFKIVSRAKCLLISYDKMSEDEAHRYIEKRAMDERVSKISIAKEIVKKYS